MSTYNVTSDASFSISDLYGVVREATKRIVISAGGIMIALMVSVDSSYAEETYAGKVMPPQSEAVAYQENTLSQLVYNKESNSYKITQADVANSNRYAAMLESYCQHKGNDAGESLRKGFDSLAQQMSVLEYDEMLARHSVMGGMNTLLMTFSNGLELNVTQESGQDEVAFSLHHGDALLYIGSERPKVLAEKMLNIIQEAIPSDGELS